MMDFLTRAANFAPSTFNAEARTVEVVALSGLAPVLRAATQSSPSPDGATSGLWWEELDARGADLSGFIGGPVLKDHRPQVDSHVGVVEGARAEGDQIIAAVRFGTKPAADEVFADVGGGLLRGVSLGYRVLSWQRMAPRDGHPVFRAVKWTARELSFVPIPADAGAIVRGDSMITEQSAAPEPAATEQTAVLAAPAVQAAPPAPTTLHVVVETRSAPVEPAAPAIQEEVSAVTTETRAEPAVIATQPAPVQMTRAAVNAEIRTIAAASGLDQAWIDGQIDAMATVEQARGAAMDAILTRQARPVATAHIVRDHTDPAEIRSRMADAIVARATFQAPPDHAREFMHFRVADMIVQLANTRGAKLDGRNHIEAVEHLFTRSGMHTTSDFPLLLQDAGNKILLPRYQAAAPSYRTFSSQRSFTDFKDHKFLRLGDFPALKEVKEAGETKYGTVSENRESIAAKEYGAGLSIGRRALINDDLSAFSDFTGMIGVRVAQDENALVYTLISSDGPTMSDGNALFSSAHGNKAGSGTGVTVAAVGAAVAAMRNQKTLDGINMSIGPRYLVVGTAKELEARQFLTAIQATQTDKVNPYAGAFELVVDANNSGNRWQMFADPVVLPTVVYGYVNGATGPQIRSEIDFDTRALKVAVGLDFACGVIDYRGAYLNAGA